MSGELLYGVNLVVLFPLIALFLYAGAEAGFRYGQKTSHRVSKDIHSHVSTVEGALLGLLALLLGFAFAMAINRFDSRKQLILEEVNSIQTALLRAQMLPRNQAVESYRLLCDYVDSQIENCRAGADESRLRTAEERTSRIQFALWDQATSAARENADEVTTGYYIETLNTLFDTHARRTIAMGNHVPEIILLLLLLVAILTMSVTGYSSGLHSKRLRALRGILIILIAATMTVIIDLDRPRRGLIQVSETQMLKLQSQLPKYSARANP